MARQGDEIYFESHTPLEDDTVGPDERLELLLEEWNANTDSGFTPKEIERARDIAATSNGLPLRISFGNDDEVMARVRVVRNTVEIDPEAPTLAEVREMIDEAVQEAEEEADEQTPQSK
jgi:hypothetical protein